MAPNCLLNQMKTSIRMIIVTPKYAHLHSMHFFSASICWVITLCLVTYCTLWEIIRYMSHSPCLWILTINVERQNTHTPNIFTARRAPSDYVLENVWNMHYNLLGAMVLVWATVAVGKEWKTHAPEDVCTSRVGTGLFYAQKLKHEVPLA